MQRKLLVIISVDFGTTGQLPITYSAFVKYLRKKWTYSEAVNQLFIDFIEFGIPMKLVRLTNMSVNET
jgi:hypothetical protein